MLKSNVRLYLIRVGDDGNASPTKRCEPKQIENDEKDNATLHASDASDEREMCIGARDGRLVHERIKINYFILTVIGDSCVE